MDWTGTGLRERVLSWLEQTAEDRYARDKRLDPFATSMRDFDDVSPNLVSIRAGHPLDVTDPRQRITDLKNAGLILENGSSLTELGSAVLDAWERYGVASNSKGDELARLLLMALEARRIKDTGFAEFYEYWEDLRTYFNPLELIHNWDALYALNYLDFPREGFAPGVAYRDKSVPATEIEFDLAEYARNTATSSKAIEGGERIENAIGGKIPRGRHRATFCMALEIAISNGHSAPSILESFGIPKKPGIWAAFNETDKAKILAIINDYELEVESPVAEIGTTPVISEQSSGDKNTKPALVLPENIDFSQVLVIPPVPKVAKTTTASGKGGAKKIDYQQRAQSNDAIGKLSEDFAVAFERWRLKDHPDLLKKLRHVSKEDDSLGYDIESFELDGTPRFVEVKGTLGPMESRFFLSANELACAQSRGEQYVILRVAQLQKGPICCEIRHPFDGKLELIPTEYSVTFKST